jgi:hypothetical protein
MTARTPTAPYGGSVKLRPVAGTSKSASHRIYWDSVTLLTQLGTMRPAASVQPDAGERTGYQFCRGRHRKTPFGMPRTPDME